MLVRLADIAAAVQEDEAAAVLAGFGQRQISKAGGLLPLVRNRIRDVGDLRLLCSDSLDALVAGLDPGTPIEIE